MMIMTFFLPLLLTPEICSPMLFHKSKKDQIAVDGHYWMAHSVSAQVLSSGRVPSFLVLLAWLSEQSLNHC